jgi:hypothetical protein
MAKQLNSVNAIIEHFGGLYRFADFCGLSPTAVWNWRNRGFPPEYRDALKRRLKAHGVTAPAELWKQRALPPRIKSIKLQAAE